MSNTLFSVSVNQIFNYGGYNFITTSVDNSKNMAKIYIADNNTGVLNLLDSIPVSSGVVTLYQHRLNTYINYYKEHLRIKNRNIKKNPVEVIRYIRPLDEYCDGMSNMYGVTFVFTLDYEKRRINVGISVCNGDNFDKKLGVDIAKQYGISVLNANMPTDIYNCNSDDSLVDWFMKRLPCEPQPRDVVFNMKNRTIRLITEIYACSVKNKENL